MPKQVFHILSFSELRSCWDFAMKVQTAFVLLNLRNKGTYPIWMKNERENGLKEALDYPNDHNIWFVNVVYDVCGDGDDNDDDLYMMVY